MLVEMPIWWSEANTAIALGYYGGQRYSTLLPTSSRSITTTWSEWRSFGFCVSRDQLTATMKEMNDRFELNFSLNPDDYRLELFGIGPEMYVAGGKQGYMSMKVKDVRVYTSIRH